MDKPTVKHVAIVCFVQDINNAKIMRDLGHPSPRVISYAVTLDPERLSPTGEFIRLGQWGDGMGQGDEITGWILLEDLAVEEILAEWDGTQFHVVEPSAQRAAA